MNKQRTTFACSQELDTFAAPGWKAVRRGLSLTSGYFGAVAFLWIYVIWLVIAAILGLVVMPFAIRGEVDFPKDVLNPFALYGFVWPMALTLAALWSVKLLSRFLWCRIPQPAIARLLALAAVAGRLSTLFASVWFWRASEPFGKRLLLPEMIGLSGMAWLCLIAEWGFLRVLERQLIRSAPPSLSLRELDQAVASATEAQGVNEPSKRSFFRRDLGEWFKGRFPKSHNFVVWIVFPVGYVAASAMADNGDPRAIPEAILRLAVIAPVILQIFWIPGARIDRLIDFLSPRNGQEKVASV